MPPQRPLSPENALAGALDSVVSWTNQSRTHLLLSGWVAHEEDRPVLIQLGFEGSSLVLGRRVEPMQLAASCSEFAPDFVLAFKARVPCQHSYSSWHNFALIALVTLQSGRTIETELSASVAPPQVAHEQVFDTPASERCTALYSARAALLRRAGTLPPQPLHESPAVSVVVLAPPQTDLLWTSLAALHSSPVPCSETILVGPANIIEEAAAACGQPRVQCLSIERAGSVPAALNQAAKSAAGSILLFLDGRLELISHPFPELAELFGQDSQAGAAVGRIIGGDGLLNEAGSIVWRDGSLARCGTGLPAASPQHSFRKDVECSSALLLSAPRSMFLELGGFDPTFQEPDLAAATCCMMLREKGLRVIYEPFLSAVQCIDPSRAPNSSRQYEELLFQSSRPNYLRKRPAAPAEKTAALADDAAQRRLLCFGPGRFGGPEGQSYEKHLVFALTELGLKVTYVTALTAAPPASALLDPLHTIEVVSLQQWALAQDSGTAPGSYSLVWIVGLECMRLFLEACAQNRLSNTAIRVFDAQLEAPSAPLADTVCGGSELKSTSRILRSRRTNASYPLEPFVQACRRADLVLVEEGLLESAGPLGAPALHWSGGDAGLEPACVAQVVAEASRVPRTGTRRQEPLETEWHLRPFSSYFDGSAGNSSASTPDEVIDVIVPLYNAAAEARECIKAVVRNTDRTYDLYLIDDGSTDEGIARLFSELSAAAPPAPLRRLFLLRNRSNLGFAETVNRVLSLSKNHAVILNSDTEVPPLWLSRLAAPVLNDEGTASATPFSNNATICSFPRICAENELPLALSTAELDNFILNHGSAEPVLVPTGVGFCMLLNRAVLDNIGFFDSGVFAAGYGEENDWCRRAEAAGYRSVAVPNLFVKHKGGASFGREKKAAAEINLSKVQFLHPDYALLVEDFITRDPLAEFRNRICSALSLAHRQEPGVLYITAYGLKGGSAFFLEQRLRARCSGERQYVMELDNDHLVFRDKSCCPAPFYYLTVEELSEDIFKQFIDVFRIERIFVNQLVGIDSRKVMELVVGSGCPYQVFIHDYYYACPGVYLLNAEYKYCGGETRPSCCQNCISRGVVSEDFFKLPSYAKNIVLWRSLCRTFLTTAQKVICPSETAKDVLRGYYPEIAPAVERHTVSGRCSYSYSPSFAGRQPFTLAVLGALGRPKGAGVVYGLRGLSEQSCMDLRIVVIGVTDRHSELITPDGRFIITGSYRPEDVSMLLHYYQAGAVLIPSLWPETFSYTTAEALYSGYPVITFSGTAPAELVACLDGGWLLEERTDRAVFNLMQELLNKPGRVAAKAAKLQQRLEQQARGRDCWEPIAAAHGELR